MDFDFSPDAPPNAPPEESEPLLLTAEQASQVLQIGRSHLYELLGRGEIKSIKIGRSRRIPVIEIERYIESGMEDGEEM